MPTSSRADFGTLFNSTNDAIFIIDLDGHFLEVNQMTYESLGYTRDEILQLKLMDIDASLNAKQVLERIKETYQQGNSTFETVHVCKDSSTIPVELSNRLIKYEGNPAIVSICRDITKRKKLEESLKKSEKMYSTLVEKGNDGIVLIQDRVLKFANSRAAEITGYTKEEIIGNPFLKYIPEEYRELVKKRYIKRLANEKNIPNNYEICILSKKGSNIPVEINSSLIEYEGKPTILAIIRDISKRKQAEIALKASEEKYSTLVEKGNDGIVIIQDGLLKFANSKAAEIVGQTKEEILGKPFSDYIPEEYKEFTLKRYKKRLDEPMGVPCKYETALLAKDGSEIPVEINVSLIKYEGSLASMAIIRDITERKMAEENLKIYAEELKKSNELKDLFTDILTHDLLNSAGVVKGFTEVLLEMEEDDKKIQTLQTIERNNEKLIDMVELASKFAKLEDVKQLEFETMDIDLILKDVVGNFSPYLKKKNIRVELLMDGEYLAIVNPVIEEVFSNLLSNAIKYSPKESRILIDVLDYGDKWKVTVTDFDGGIPDESKPYIFERFRRIEKGGVKGTGLGLAIVKRIIDLHRGEVGVEDNPAGQGSVFWVTVRKA